jgi:hypothetical protein
MSHSINIIYNTLIRKKIDQKRAEMAEVVSIEVRKNWSGTFQSLEIAVAFFKIA